MSPKKAQDNKMINKIARFKNQRDQRGGVS